MGRNQVLKKLHSNTVIPKKKLTKTPLTKEDKENKRLISSQKVTVQNIIRELKIFKIVAANIEIEENDLE
ncbi:MAG: hypothetical protein H7101_07140 [Deinococcales bacterium]|nr:hypothetical protein [Chitinophagaceae bacterium]